MSTLHYQRPSFQYTPYCPVTPPPVLPLSYEENPTLWMSMTKAQRYATKELRRAEQPHLEHSPSPDLFFQSWTPETTPCHDPLCRMPHHQSQTTSHSPCSQTTSPPTTTPSIGSPTIQVTPCKEKDLKAFRSPVSAQFPQTAQLVLQDVVVSTVEENGLANLPLAQRASLFPQTHKAKSRARATAKYKRQKQAESTANTMLSLPCLFLHPHQSPPNIRLLPKPAHLMTPPYQEDIRGRPPANLLELRNELLLSFPKIATTAPDLIL